MADRPEDAPPRLWRGLLRRLVPSAERDVVDGELSEEYALRALRHGVRSASGWYRRQVLGFLVRARTVRGTSTNHEAEGTTMGWFDGVGQDLRWALRGLRKRPIFAAVAICTLALGIGANSAIFTLVSAHFLAPLPYERPDELVLLWETDRNSLDVTTVAPGNYWTWREDARSFTDIAAFNVDFATLSGEGGAAERVNASVVVPHFFDLVGARPALGAGFSEDAARSSEDLVVLSHSLWVRRYGADPGVVGRDVRIDGRPHTVVGVMPATFRQPERSLSWQTTELWRPMLLDGGRGDHGSRYLRTIARLAPGVEVEAAREEMTLMAARLADAFPEDNAGRTVLVRTLDEYLMGSARPTLVMLLVAGAAVLLIVCANVANLTLARGEERRNEFAVRAALGSGRTRLLRQIVVEGVVLSLLGATVGAVIVFGGRDLLQVVQVRYFSSLVDVAIDWRVVGFTAGIAFLSGFLFGLPLATAAGRAELRAGLVEGGQRGGGGLGASATRNLLIVGQVALATTLLVVAGLLSRSFSELVRVPPGFDPVGAIVFTASAPAATYPQRADYVAYHDELLAEIEAIPGVRRVGAVSDLPFTTENMWTSFLIEGREVDPTAPPTAEYHVVRPGYFAAMGIPLVAGSLPAEGPIEGELPILVNEQMAAAVWPDGEAVGSGMALDWSDTISMRVVGVVGDILDDGYDAVAEPVFFIPFDGLPRRRMSYVVRAAGEPGPVMTAIRAAATRVDADVPASDLRLLDGLMAETVARPRAASLIGATFALIALLVAAAGIYGVLSYAVQARTREIGIRSALGASAEQIVRMVMGHSTRLVVLGLVAGVAGALVAGSALSELLFDVRAWDLLSIAVATLGLGGVAMLASWLPARRAVAIDPREALRAE